ncbi:hypothetical protein [Thiohalomonas denitrificans]|uniref:Uncharacterized protein n=1 Tax=Thiohalomonas denitrificans TaxID=415747 RepID=A0A1G5R208_9GAMM|nr:hypothetical protein [Thiohalomonas denitrificans]SCZ67840.1 hypothetical protein SAMN03097708_03210 [Thiohalomonas denitrificans]
MNREKIFHVFSGFLVSAALAAGYVLGNSGTQAQIDTAFFLLHSEQDLGAVMNLKAMKALREGRQEEALRFMETWVSGQLRSEGVRPETLDKARDYQSEYCKGACLDVQ